MGRRIALIYTGNLRSWQHCKYNHWETFGEQDVSGFFFTDKDPRETDDVQPKRPRVYQWIKYHESFYDNPFGDHPFNSRKAPENTAHQTLNQWISSFTGFMLTPTGYDIYVRIRADIKFNGPLNFDQFDCTGNNIYIPEGLNFGGVCDQFAFGSYKVMKAYYGVLLDCAHLWYRDGVLFHSETMQLKNLESKGINIVRYGSPQHDLIR